MTKKNPQSTPDQTSKSVRAKRSPGIAKARREKGIELLKAGYSMTEIAGLLGVTRQAVYTWNAMAGGIIKTRLRGEEVITREVVSTPVAERIAKPDPEDVRRVREECGLTQGRAALMVSPNGRYQTWGEYESPVESSIHQDIPLLVWEMFLLLVDRHPTYKLTKRR